MADSTHDIDGDVNESHHFNSSSHDQHYGTIGVAYTPSLGTNSTTDYSTAADYHSSDAVQNQPLELSYRDARRVTIISIILVIVCAICISGVAQSGKTIYTTSNYTGASLITWCSESMLLVFYPTIVAFLLYSGQSYHEIYRQASRFYKQNGTSFKMICLKIFLLTFLTVGGSYLYLIALLHASATIVSTLYSSFAAITYVFSLLLFREPFVFLRCFAVVISITGVVLMAIAGDHSSFQLLGIILGLGCALFAACFRIITTIIIGSTSVIETTLFLTIMGIQCLCIFWIPILIFHFAKLEVIAIADFPWSAFIAAIGFRLAFNSCSYIGIAYTEPIYVSIGILLAIPINAIIDVTIRHYHFHILEIIGTILLVVAFMIFTIPLHIISAISAKIRLFISHLVCHPITSYPT